MLDAPTFVQQCGAAARARQLRPNTVCCLFIRMKTSVSIKKSEKKEYSIQTPGRISISTLQFEVQWSKKILL